MAAQPPAPPVTIRVPGAGPPPERVADAADRSPRRRVVALVAAIGLLGTLAVTAARSEPPPARSSAEGISAEVTLAGRPQRGAGSVRLQLAVDIEPLEASSRAERQVTVVGLGGQGFATVLGPEPLRVTGDVASRLQVGAEVSVNDCAVETSAPRQLELWIRRGSRAQAEVPVRSNPDVVRVLDRLVAGVCGRPRG